MINCDMSDDIIQMLGCMIYGDGDDDDDHNKIIITQKKFIDKEGTSNIFCCLESDIVVIVATKHNL